MKLGQDSLDRRLQRNCVLQLGSWHSDPYEQCHALRLHRIFCYTR